MAIVGYFSSLAEAQKFVQSKLLAGVVQEIYEVGQLLPMLPVFTIDSKDVQYNRQTTPPSASFYDIHEQIPFTAQSTGDTKTATLKRVSQAAILDRFMMDTYKDPNDYRTLILSGLTLGCLRTIEDKLIYGDTDNDAAEFDGIGHLFEEDAVSGDDWTDANGSVQQYDMSAGALSLATLRQLIDKVRPKPDILLMTRTMQNTLSAAAFEKGINTNVPGATITMTKNEFGFRVPFFDGIKIVISDYLSEDEVDHTGDKSSSVTTISSIFAIRFGQIMDGGLSLGIGGRTGGVNFFHVDEIPVMEDYDAEALRLTAYATLALGSSVAMARIHSIGTTTAVTA